jgi:hypothetical protein
VDFSETRDLFVIIFQIPGPNYKIMDCGLILEKPRGLNAKWRKLEFPGIIFQKETHGGPRSPSRRRLARERPDRRPRAWNLTAVEGNGREDGGEPHRLQEGAAESGTRPGDGGEQSVEEALGGVDIADSKASN